MFKTKSNRHKHCQTLKNKNYLNKLKKMYPTPKYDSTIITPHDKYNTTYGEMTYDGMDNMFSQLKNYGVNKCKTFMDLGCGRGSICLYMASKPNIKNSIGIELVKNRFDDAVQLKNNLGQNRYTSKLNFYNDDMFQYFNENSFDSNPYLIWISNLLFPNDLTNQLYNHLSENLPNDSIICSSKQPTNCNDNLCKLIHEFNVPMSWSDNSHIYAYQIKK